MGASLICFSQIGLILDGTGAAELSRRDMSAIYLLYLLVKILHSKPVMLTE